MRSFIKKDLEKSFKDFIFELDSLRGKTILITGGTGFIGSWIARAITWLNDEHDFQSKIIIMARNPKILEEKDSELYQRKDIMYIRSDVRSIHNLPNDVQYIFHTAASPDNRIHISDPVSTMDIIAFGTKALMDAASRLPSIEAIVHLSSGQVYGKAPMNGEALSEKTFGSFIKNDITSIYPEAKRYSETVCLAYRSLYKLPITIVRPFSFIGPYQELNKPWAINSFMQEALNGQSIRIVGSGEPQRSYLYASDMAAWLLLVLAKGKRGDVYNLGSSEGVSLLNVASHINQCITKKVDVIIQNHNHDDSKFIPNLEHIMHDLDVKAAFSFQEALEHTIRWNLEYRNEHEKN